MTSSKEGIRRLIWGGGMTTFRRELNVSDLERMCIPKRYWECSFSEITDSGDPSPKTVVRSYFERMDAMISRGVGLLPRIVTGKHLTLF